MSQVENRATFSTKEFSFSEAAFKIYKNHKIENTPFNEITLVTVKKGSDLKRPRAAFVFGIVLLIICVNLLGDYNFDLGEFFAGAVILRILSILFFVGGVGCYAIYTALPIHPVIEIKHKDWTERLSLSTIIKVGKLESFSEFLRVEFGGRFRRSI
jgi:hypothetical protein